MKRYVSLNISRGGSRVVNLVMFPDFVKQVSLAVFRQHVETLWFEVVVGGCVDLDSAEEHNLASLRVLLGVDDLSHEVVAMFVQYLTDFGVGVFRFFNAFLVAPDHLLDVLHLVIIAHRVDFGFVKTVFHGVIRTDGSPTGCRFRFLLTFP